MEEKVVFYLGSCTVDNELRMEDGTQNKHNGQDAILGLVTSSSRLPEQPCAICYYDSNDEHEDVELETEFTRRTVTPVGRYAALCIRNAGSFNADETDVSRVCSHTFHTSCIYKWINTESPGGGFTCPVCRGGLQKQRLEGMPELYEVQPEYVVRLWPNGKKKEEYFERAGQKDGIYKSYYIGGDLELECIYKNNLKEGREKHYYDDGNNAIKSQVDFRNDKKHGLSCWFTSQGKMIGEAHYDSGIKSGSHKEWYTDTTIPRLRSIEHHLQGKRHGLFMKWSFKGQLLLYGVYVNDEKDGRFIAWYEERYGIKIKEFYNVGIRHGKCVEYYEPDIVQRSKTGPIPKEVGFYDHGMRTGIWRNYWSNGQLKTETEYNSVGLRDGVHREWNRFGRPFKVFRFEADELDGVCETYDETANGIGGPLETATYQHGELHGLYVQRYKNTGQPKIVKVYNHQSEIVARWFSRTGDILMSTDKRETTKNRKKKMHPDIIRVERSTATQQKLHTRFVDE